MAYHDDLLRLASDLVLKGETQAELRRAVSTAYSALFHLLVSETALNWSRDSSRNALGRMFDHSLMKKVSSRIADSKKTPFTGEDPTIVSGLRFLAEIFVELQNERHVADYDNGRIWTPLDAIVPIASAKTAFEAWNEIKHTDIAQEYLVSLLIRPRD
jgi:hypothetical protein